jgi:hypothetical protein
MYLTYTNKITISEICSLYFVRFHMLYDVKNILTRRTIMQSIDILL